MSFYSASAKRIGIGIACACAAAVLGYALRKTPIMTAPVRCFQNIFGLKPDKDICDLDSIYDKSKGDGYFFPRNILESYLSGKAFDHPEPYSVSESQKLREDINQLYQKIVSKNPVKDNLAVITAGAPGSGKTVKLKQELEASRKNYAYVCPDDVCLRNQTQTYMADLRNSDGSPAARQLLYNKWRPGSNAATQLLLANLIRERYAFYFGSTSSSPSTGKFLEYLKKQGYRIRFIHISAPDNVRWESIKERDKTFVQTTLQDVQEKGLLVPQRIKDTYLEYADEIDFYYREGTNENAILAAKWRREAENREGAGTLQILSPPNYEKIKNLHNLATETLKRPDLKWEATVENRSQINE